MGNKPASSLAVSLGKALNGTRPPLCGRTGGPVFPPKRGLVAGRAFDRKTNATLQKCRYLLWRLLIGNKTRSSRSKIDIQVVLNKTDASNR